MRTTYYNGLVYAGELPLVTAFAVEDGRFVAVGSDAELLAAESQEKIDLDGKFVCAGFNDSHMHLLNYGLSLCSVELGKHTNSLEELLASISDYIEANHIPEGEWVTGRGWNQDYFTDVKRMPSRADLDRVSTAHPICVTRCCGHCLAVNSKALEILGIDEGTVSPEGGKIGRENGQLDGRFYDNALGLVQNRIPLPDKETLKNYVRKACRGLNSYGVTSSQTDDYCLFRQIPCQQINEIYQELEAAGELTVRVYEQCNFETLSELQEFVEAGNMTGKGSDYFRIGPLKMLGDGSLGARTAYLREPYSDEPDTVGLPIFNQEQFDTMIGYANAKGMQVAIHAIGDACLDNVLTAIEKALQEHPRADHRHGIVHCQITAADQLQKIADLRLHVYAQSIFLDYDTHILEDRVGAERASTSYAWKTLMKKGVTVSNGTDCPVELPNALAGMQCAVTRRSLNGDTAPYLPEEAFTIKEALDSYTMLGAYSSFMEHLKGRIAPNYLADFVVLDQNLFEVAPDRIKEVQVLATYLGGERVY